MTTTDIPAPAARKPGATTTPKRRPKRESQGPAWVFLSPWVLGAIVLTLLPMAVSHIGRSQ
ncbi:ABC transporter permease, partial [Streptomyces sp. NPDC006356]